MRNIPKRRGKRVFSLSFLDLSSHTLPSGSPGPPKDFRVKEPAHLGEPVTSGVSISSPGRAAITPNAFFFSINRHEGEAEERLQGQKVMELTKERKKKTKEEETKSRCC